MAAAQYTTLTADEKEAIMASRADQGRVVTGMAKWEIHFTDGNTCTMLSDQCRNSQEAMQAAIERFGHRVKDVL